MYRLIQNRWIKGSEYNFPNIVGEYRRRKEAIGQQKHHLNSHIEMLRKHEFDLFDWDDVNVYDTSVEFFKDGELVYSCSYELEEVMSIKDMAEIAASQTEPKKPKINIIAELERILERTPAESGLLRRYDIQELIDRVKSKS